MRFSSPFFFYVFIGEGNTLDPLKRTGKMNDTIFFLLQPRGRKSILTCLLGILKFIKKWEIIEFPEPRALMACTSLSIDFVLVLETWEESKTRDAGIGPARFCRSRVCRRKRHFSGASSPSTVSMSWLLSLPFPEIKYGVLESKPTDF